MSVTQDILEELAQGLCAILGTSLLRIVLYGSVARLEDTPESDVDIAVFLREKLRKEDCESMIHFISEFGMKYDRVFSIIDVEEEKFLKWIEVLPFYQNIQKEGIILWTAA